MNIKEYAYKAIRIITIAPIMAFLLLTALFVTQEGMFRNACDYIIAIVFLVLLPVLAYPLQPFIPGFKAKGRKGQRSLAIVMAVVGYIGGIITALVTKASENLLIVYLTYLFSGIFILIFNKFLKIKMSGHACGSAGPIACALYFIGAYALVCVPIVALVYYSSVKMQRHKLYELVLGSIAPIISLGLAILTVNLI